jgi:hypothetical protein
MNSLEVLAG